MSKVKHAFAVGLPVLAAVLLAIKPLTPESKIGLVTAAIAMVNYFLQSPFVKEQP